MPTVQQLWSGEHPQLDAEAQRFARYADRILELKRAASRRKGDIEKRQHTQGHPSMHGAHRSTENPQVTQLGRDPGAQEAPGGGKAPDMRDACGGQKQHTRGHGQAKVFVAPALSGPGVQGGG